MTSLGVGIIGFGRIGAEHAGWLRAAMGLEPLAVADTTPARRLRAEKSELRAYEQVDTLLSDNTIEIVLVSTPTAMHFEHAMAALRAGRHVMIEKPMAMNLEQAQTLLAEAKSRRRVLSVFHNRRWDVDYLTVKSAIEVGTFGRVINIESRLGQWASCVGPAATEYRPGWRNEAAFGGGGLFDWGSHFIDQLWRLMWPAKPQRIFAQLRGNVWTRDCDDFARVCIDFDHGAVGMVEVNTTTTRPLPRWHIDGTEGSADSPYSLEFDPSTWSKLSFQRAGDGAVESIPSAESGLNESQIWQHFAAAVRREGEPAISAASVIPTTILLDAARESSKQGIAIELAPNAPWVY